MIIVTATLSFATQADRDDAAAASAEVQRVTRDEPGCLAHCFAPDPAEPTHLQVYELWTDATSLAAHFRHPNYADMVQVLRSNPGFRHSENRLWAADDRGPVYGSDGAFRFDAVADAGEHAMNGAFDLHAHVVLEGAFGCAGELGPFHGIDERGREFFRVGEYVMAPIPYRGSVFMDVDRRLETMDALGIDRQLLSSNPLTFFGRIPADPAITFARASNDAMAALVGSRADRFLGAAQLPLQDPAAAVTELDRAITDLGLAAAHVGSDYGFGFDDRRLDDVFARLVELDVPLFVHGVTNDGFGPPPDARLRRHGLDLVVGYTYEETLTVAALILGGVLDRHPGLDVCISHGGGAIAFLSQRFESMAAFRRTDVDLVAGLRRLWFDSHLEPGPALDLVVATVGVDRMVFGTNFGGWDTPTEVTDFDRSLTANANRLLRLEDTP